MAITRQTENKQALYDAANLLQDLNDEVVYVGGRIVGLLVTDILEDDVRPTFDIDVAVEITGITAHYALEEKLSSLGFKPEGNINCQYLHGDTILDIANPVKFTVYYLLSIFLLGLRLCCSVIASYYQNRISV